MDSRQLAYFRQIVESGPELRAAYNRLARERTMGEMFSRLAQTDLEQRQTEPFLTARDVHRYIVKAETDDLRQDMVALACTADTSTAAR